MTTFITAPERNARLTIAIVVMFSRSAASASRCACALGHRLAPSLSTGLWGREYRHPLGLSQTVLFSRRARGPVGVVAPAF
jgi:hypothetical protein